MLYCIATILKVPIPLTISSVWPCETIILLLFSPITLGMDHIKIPEI